MSQRNANMQSIALANLPRDTKRLYLFIVPTADIVVTMYNDDATAGEPFTIPLGGHWNPIPCPVNKFTFTGTGTMVTG